MESLYGAVGPQLLPEETSIRLEGGRATQCFGVKSALLASAAGRQTQQIGRSHSRKEKEEGRR